MAFPCCCDAFGHPRPLASLLRWCRRRKSHRGLPTRSTPRCTCASTPLLPLLSRPAGHVYPGIVFILWGSWWAWNTVVLYLWRSPRRPYRGRAWYPLPLRPLHYLEPALKLLVPLVAVNMELWLDHEGDWQ